jgi:hypothetical protein
MAEDNTGKATALHHELQCAECGVGMWAKRAEAGFWYYQHSSLAECANAGKRFKVVTVELEEC